MKKIIATSVLGIGIIFGGFVSTYASTTGGNTLVYVNQGVSGKKVLESIQSIEKRQKIRFDKAIKKNDLKLAQKIIDETKRVTGRNPPFKIPKPIYKKTEFFKATAYCITGWTKSETWTTPRRTIAVDPNKIKLGTKVYITFPYCSYMNGYYIAEDTGSSIKCNSVDIYIPGLQNCLNFGVQQVKITW